MKKHYLLFLLLSAYQLSNGQFFDSSVHYLAVNCGYMSGLDCFHRDYQIVLDSNQADTQYYHVQYAPGSMHGIEFLKVYNKKVFAKSNYKYGLLYDFGIQIGDTVIVTGGIGPSMIFQNSKCILDSVSKIKLGDEIYNLQHVKIKGFPFQFIDSIGSLENGLFYYEHYQFESRSDLVALCKKGNLLVYKDHQVVKTGKNSCHPVFYENSIHEFNQSVQLQIFPNPGSGLFTLNTEEWLAKDIQVVNANGQLVHEVSGSYSNELDLGQLSPGIYQVLVKIDGYLLAQKLLVD